MHCQGFLFFLIVSLHVFHLSVSKADSDTNDFNKEENDKCNTLVSKSDLTYHYLYPIPTSTISSGEDLMFEFMLTGGSATIRLQTSPNKWDEDAYDVMLGIFNNTVSQISKLHQNIWEESVLVDTKDIMHATEMRGFWINISAQGNIQVGKKGDKLPFMEWRDPAPILVKYFSFRALYAGKNVVMHYDCSSA